MADKTPKAFSENDLSDAELKDYKFVKDRITRLQKSRLNHYGTNLDTLWADADKNYTPHRLRTKGKKMVVEDEDKGWRGALVQLGTNDWQSDISQSNVYVKIQAAIAILIDQNPSGVFTPMSKKFAATTALIEQLYKRSWEFARSKAQLRLFVFNLAKYGWAIARTYPLKVTRKVKVIDQYNPDDPSKTTYLDKEVVEYNDVFRENLDPRNCWIDDQAVPNSPMTLRDWTWRKVYSLDDFKEEFAKYPRAQMVKAGGNTQETLDTARSTNKKVNETEAGDLVEVFFYENRVKDLFVVLAGGVPIILDPLPISDTKGIKRLSCWQTYWTLRNAQSCMGIGIYEAIRFDQAMLDRFRNMTIDQVTLSIYKMFFYTGTQSLSDTGEIKIQPGVGKQVLNPKDITWLETPGPGQDAYLGIESMRKDLDEASGITDPLLGAVTGKTAFELAQAKESALKRLRNPLDNILEALNEEGYTTIALMQLIYSIPETYEISDQDLIEAYMKEIEGDPNLFERTPALDEQDQPVMDETGQPQQNFTAKVYPEFPLNLQDDEKGNLIESKDTQFFRLKPGSLDWDGIVNIKSQSLLSPSKQIDKALNLEMYNVLIPLFAQPPELYKKTAEDIIKGYDKDPKDILPESWLNPPPPSLFVNPGQMAQQAAGGQAPVGQPPDAPQQQNLQTAPPTNPQSIVSKISGGMSSAATGT